MAGIVVSYLICCYLECFGSSIALSVLAQEGIAGHFYHEIYKSHCEWRRLESAVHFQVLAWMKSHPLSSDAESARVSEETEDVPKNSSQGSSFFSRS